MRLEKILNDKDYAAILDDILNAFPKKSPKDKPILVRAYVVKSFWRASPQRKGPMKPLVLTNLRRVPDRPFKQIKSMTDTELKRELKTIRGIIQ